MPEMMIFVDKALHNVIPLADADDKFGGLANKNLGYIFEDDLSLRPVTSVWEYITKFDPLNVQMKTVEFYIFVLGYDFYKYFCIRF